MRTNGGQHPEEILAEIDRTRGEMDRTLSAIEHRLTPGQLVDQGLDFLRHNGAVEFVQNLGGSAKQNPMPVALTAIGIAWLMATGRNSGEQNYSGEHDSGPSRLGSMKDSIGGAASSMKDTLSGTASSVRDRAGSMADTTRNQWDRARGGMEYMVNEQPLALGAIGLAVGALLAAIAPRTQKEEEMLGEASRNMMDKAKQAGSEQIEKAEQKIKQAGEKPQAAEKLQASEKPQAEPREAAIERKGAW